MARAAEDGTAIAATASALERVREAEHSPGQARSRGTPRRRGWCLCARRAPSPLEREDYHEDQD